MIEEFETDLYGRVSAKKIGETSSDMFYVDEKGNYYMVRKTSAELIGKPRPICLKKEVIEFIKNVSHVT